MVERVMLLRLRKALGLGALTVGSLGSGPCGSCWEVEHNDGFCINGAEYLSFRAQAGEAGAAGVGEFGGAAGMLGAAGASGRNGEAGGATLPDHCPSKADAEAYVNAGGDRLEYDHRDLYPQYDCCYSGRITTRDRCAGGRPFLVRGVARVASIVPDSSTNDAGFVADSAHDALVRAWLEEAQSEHASIAAFARLSLVLLSLDAPLELVAEAQRASLDELSHYRTCMDQVRRLMGADVRCGAVPAEGCLEATNLEELVATNVLEGCIGETLAAAVVSERARRAKTPELREMFAAIAADEERHAALAFRILRWALTAGGAALRHAALMALGSGAPAARPRGSESWLRDGSGDAETEHAISLRTYRDVVVPLVNEIVARASVGDVRDRGERESERAIQGEGNVTRNA